MDGSDESFESYASSSEEERQTPPPPPPEDLSLTEQKQQQKQRQDEEDETAAPLPPPATLTLAWKKSMDTATITLEALRIYEFPQELIGRKIEGRIWFGEEGLDGANFLVAGAAKVVGGTVLEIPFNRALDFESDAGEVLEVQIVLVDAKDAPCLFSVIKDIESEADSREEVILSLTADYSGTLPSIEVESKKTNEDQNTPVESEKIAEFPWEEEEEEEGEKKGAPVESKTPEVKKAVKDEKGVVKKVSEGSPSLDSQGLPKSPEFPWEEAEEPEQNLNLDTEIASPLSIQKYIEEAEEDEKAAQKKSDFPSEEGEEKEEEQKPKSAGFQEEEVEKAPRKKSTHDFPWEEEEEKDTEATQLTEEERKAAAQRKQSKTEYFPWEEEEEGEEKGEPKKSDDGFQEEEEKAPREEEEEEKGDKPKKSDDGFHNEKAAQKKSDVPSEEGEREEEKDEKPKSAGFQEEEVEKAPRKKSTHDFPWEEEEEKDTEATQLTEEERKAAAQRKQSKTEYFPWEEEEEGEEKGEPKKSADGFQEEEEGSRASVSDLPLAGVTRDDAEDQSYENTISELPKHTPASHAFKLNVSWDKTNMSEPLSLDIHTIELNHASLQSKLQSLSLKVWFGEVESFADTPPKEVLLTAPFTDAVLDVSSKLELVQDIDEVLKVLLCVKGVAIASVELDIENEAAVKSHFDIDLDLIPNAFSEEAAPDTPCSSQLTPVTQTSTIPDTPPTHLNDEPKVQLTVSWKKDGPSRSVTLTVIDVGGVVLEGREVCCKMWFGAIATFAGGEATDGGKGVVTNGLAKLGGTASFPLVVDELLKIEIHLVDSTADTLIYKGMMDMDPLPATTLGYAMPLLEASGLEHAMKGNKPTPQITPTTQEADDDEDDEDSEEEDTEDDEERERIEKAAEKARREAEEKTRQDEEEKILLETEKKESEEREHKRIEQERADAKLREIEQQKADAAKELADKAAADLATAEKKRTQTTTSFVLHRVLFHATSPLHIPTSDLTAKTTVACIPALPNASMETSETVSTHSSVCRNRKCFVNHTVQDCVSSAVSLTITLSGEGFEKSVTTGVVAAKEMPKDFSERTLPLFLGEAEVGVVFVHAALGRDEQTSKVEAGTHVEVCVDRAVGVVDAKGRIPSTFATFALLSSEGSARSTQTTQTVQNSRNPIFSDSLGFASDSAYLQFAVFVHATTDPDTADTPQVLAAAIFECKNVPCSDLAVQVPLYPSGGTVHRVLGDNETTASFDNWADSADDATLGTLRLSLNIETLEAHEKQKEAREFMLNNTVVRTDGRGSHTLSLHLESAEGLAPCNVGDRTSCPYAAFYVNRQEVGMTKVFPSTLAPRFEYCLELPFPQLQGWDPHSQEPELFAEVCIKFKNEALLMKANSDGFLGEICFDVAVGDSFERKSDLRPRSKNSADLTLLNLHGSLGTANIKCDVTKRVHITPFDHSDKTLLLRPLDVHINVSNLTDLPAENHELVWVKIEVDDFIFQTSPSPVRNGAAEFAQEEKTYSTDPRSLKTLRGEISVVSKSKGTILSNTIEVGNAQEDYRRVALMRRRGNTAGQDSSRRVTEGYAHLRFECPLHHRPPVCRPTLRNTYLSIVSASGLTSGNYSDVCKPYLLLISSAASSLNETERITERSTAFSDTGSDDSAKSFGVLPPGLHLEAVHQQNHPSLSLLTTTKEGTDPVFNEHLLIDKKEVDEEMPEAEEIRHFSLIAFDRGVFIGCAAVKVDVSSEQTYQIDLTGREANPGDNRRFRFNGGSLGKVVLKLHKTSNPAVGVMVAPTQWDLPSITNIESLQVKYAVAGLAQTPLFTAMYQSEIVESETSLLLDESTLDDSHASTFPSSNPLDFSSYFGAGSCLYASLWSGPNRKLASGKIPLALSSTGLITLPFFEDQGKPFGSVDIRFKWEDTPGSSVAHKPWECLTTAPFMQEDKNTFSYTVGESAAQFYSRFIGVRCRGGSAECVHAGGSMKVISRSVFGMKQGEVMRVECKQDGVVEACFAQAPHHILEQAESRNFIRIANARGLAEGAHRVVFNLCDAVDNRDLGTSRVVDIAFGLSEYFSLPMTGPIKLQVLSAKSRTFLGEVTLPAGRRTEWLPLHPRVDVEHDNVLSQRNRGLGSVFVSVCIARNDVRSVEINGVPKDVQMEESSPLSGSPRNRAAAAARLNNEEKIQETFKALETESNGPKYAVTYINHTNKASHKSNSASVCTLTPEGATVVKCKGKIYSIGGAYSAGRGYQRLLTVYDVSSGVWRFKQQAQNATPPANTNTAPLRHGHCAVVYKAKIYVYGGFGPGGFDRTLGILPKQKKGGGGSGGGQRFPSSTSSASQCSTPLHSERRGTPQTAQAPLSQAALLNNPSIASGRGAGYHMSTWTYDPATAEWSELQTTGSALDYRAGHCSAVVANKMIVWGGWKVLVQEYMENVEDPSGGTTKARRYRVIEHRRNDMAYLDMEASRWKKIKQKGAVPSARSDASLVKHKLTLLLFGGCEENVDGIDCTPKASSSSREKTPQYFRPATPSGHHMDPQDEEDEDEDEDLTTHSVSHAEKPQSKRAHAAVCADSSIVAVNDLYLFDLESKVWRVVETAGARPTSRYGHSALLDPSKSCMMVVGGWSNNTQPLHTVFQLDLVTLMWRKVSCWDCRPPESRLGHTAIILPLTQHNENHPQAQAGTPHSNGGARSNGHANGNESEEAKPEGAAPAHSLFQLLVSGGIAQPAQHSRQYGGSNEGNVVGGPVSSTYRLRGGEPSGM